MTISTYDLGDLKLQSGEILPQAFISYETHGTLNSEKSNVIIYPTWYSGNHEDVRSAIGSDRALNPEKYFIVVPDMFGNGFSSSPSNTPPPYDRASFPAVTPYDNVLAQHRLITEKFSVTEVQLVVGFSMSAQQAFHWGALFPDLVKAIAPICGSAKTSTHNWLFLESLKTALTLDPNFNNGDYTSQPVNGLKAFTTIYAGWAFSDEFFRKNLHLAWLGQQFNSTQEFMDAWHGMFTPKNDANDLITMLNTWQSADISDNQKFNGNLSKSLSAITPRAIVMPGKTDMYFVPADSENEVALMPRAELRVIDSIHGHGAGGPGFSTPEDDQFIDLALNDLLSG